VRRFTIAPVHRERSGFESPSALVAYSFNWQDTPFLPPSRIAGQARSHPVEVGLVNRLTFHPARVPPSSSSTTFC
jgi:hypothetical protein